MWFSVRGIAIAEAHIELFDYFASERFKRLAELNM